MNRFGKMGRSFERLGLALEGGHGKLRNFVGIDPP